MCDKGGMHSEGVHGKDGEHVWQRGACMVKGMCMHGEGGVHGKGERAW